MNARDLTNGYGTLAEPTTLTLQRRLPGPVDRAWRYLVEGDLRRQWLAAGDMELRPGASFELVWRNDELSEPGDARPEGFSEESRATCEILEVEPGRLLRFRWPNVGEVSFELAPAGDDVLLTVVHRRIPDRKVGVMVSAGWHVHLDILVARVSGTKAPSLWSEWKRLRAEYEARN